MIMVSAFASVRAWSGIYDLNSDTQLVQARTNSNQEESITNVLYNGNEKALYLTLYLYGSDPNTFTNESATLIAF